MTNIENLGPVDHIIQTLLSYSDHMVHNRPGYVVKDPSSVTGVRWAPVTSATENGDKVIYQLNKVGKKSVKVRIGVAQANGQIKDAAGRVVGEFRPAGLFPEVVAWMYGQVAEVYKLDNEFVARWASYAFGQEHRDLKVVLAAFLLVQNRKGDPVVDGGKVVFHDEDYRDVGEAMVLIQSKDAKDSKDLNPKLLMRIHDVLTTPKVAEINRTLGFGKSARNPFLGRWTKTVEKWLSYRELNHKMLEGLVKAGFRSTVMELARTVGYRPASLEFFQTLRWKQKQAKDGRRSLAIGMGVKAAESWAGLSEAEICERIVSQRIGFKKIVGLLPKNSLTPAVVAAAIEAGSLSDKDLVILSPRLEDLGLLQNPEIKTRWERALKNADDMRAANVLTRVKSVEAKEKMQEAADQAAQKAVEQVMKGMRVYFIVDISAQCKMQLRRLKNMLASCCKHFL